jgi:hypothetical protein
MTYLYFIYSKTLFYFDIHPVDVVILWRGALTNLTTSQTRFFIFVFGHRNGFSRKRRRRSLLRQRFRFGWRSFIFGFRRRGYIFRFRFRDFFFRQRIQFRSFGYDYLRLLTGLGENIEQGGGALFATT